MEFYIGIITMSDVSLYFSSRRRNIFELLNAAWFLQIVYSISSADPDKFVALGKILAGAPLHRSQFRNQFSYTHTETACIYSRFYFF